MSASTLLQTQYADGKVPSYLAVELTTGIDAAQLQSLTPRLMRWSDDLWLLDLSVCASYWETRAGAARVSALGLVRQLLDGVSVRAALAEHPWQAVLLATHMRERRLTGLVVGTGPFGETLLKDLTWDAWWACSEELSEHIATEGRRRFNPAQFKSQCAQLTRAARRLGLARPSDLGAFPAPGVQRRFGAVLKDMAQWAFQAPAAATEGLFRHLPSQRSVDLFESGFPWQSFAFASLPSMVRHLESPLCEWSHMEALLREDFDRLCALSSWLAGEKVVSLEWQLVLPDWSHLVIPIRFRHPHSLHLEKGSHATALLQALYSFESSPLRSRAAAKAKDKEDELWTAVMGWTLIVKERLTLPPRGTGLFGEHLIGDLSLLALENKLKTRLEGFTLRPDWVPEDSYAEGGSDVSGPAERHALAMIAAERPLYLYRRPMAFDPEGRSCAWKFTERTMGKWWSGERQLQRDYYRLTDGELKDQWVFKEPGGQTYVHGVYA